MNLWILILVGVAAWAFGSAGGDWLRRWRRRHLPERDLEWEVRQLKGEVDSLGYEVAGLRQRVDELEQRQAPDAEPPLDH